jgi:hypothetical protein
MLRTKLCALLLGLGACSDDTKPKADLASPPKEAAVKSCPTSAFLPADAKVGDYKQDGAPQVATNGIELKALIDGGSEKYEQNSFLCMVLAKYKSASKGVSAELWVFDQTDAAGADAAMKAVLTPDDADLAPTIGDASKENVKLPFGYTAIMRKQRYLGRAVLADKKAEGSADASSLLREIAAAIK